MQHRRVSRGPPTCALPAVIDVARKPVYQGRARDQTVEKSQRGACRPITMHCRHGDVQRIEMFPSDINDLIDAEFKGFLIIYLVVVDDTRSGFRLANRNLRRRAVFLYWCSCIRSSTSVRNRSVSRM